MSRKEAFRRVLQHQPVAPVPYSIKFTAEAIDRMRDRLGPTFDPLADTGSYVVASHTNTGWEEVAPGHFRDFFDVTWNKTVDRTLGVVDEPLLSCGSFGDYRFPDPGRFPVYDLIERNNARYPDHFHMVSIGFALFERAWSLLGMEELLVGLLTEPEFIAELLSRITEVNLGVIERAARLGVDAVHLGDDWGSQGGPMLSPDLWRQFILPPFRKTCRFAHDQGLLVSLHCCGNVEPLMEDIHACGVDVFDPFQPEAMDIQPLRETFRGRMAFWGGLSVQRTLPFGSPDDVRRETEWLLRELAPGGGFVPAPSHSITGDVPPENVLAFLDVVRNQAGKGSRL